MLVKLSGLRLKNFKSYYQLNEIFPFHEFSNLIIGPNGTGKSNIIDSFLLVLFRKNLDSRSKKKQVLISFNETETTIFSVIEILVKFSQIDYKRKKNLLTEIYIGKKIFNLRNSQYMINGKGIKYNQLSVLLKKLGFNLTENCFIIQQGSIEEIVMLPSLETNKKTKRLLEFLDSFFDTSLYILALKFNLQLIFIKRKTILNFPYNYSNFYFSNRYNSSGIKINLFLATKRITKVLKEMEKKREMLGSKLIIVFKGKKIITKSSAAIKKLEVNLWERTFVARNKGENFPIRFLQKTIKNFNHKKKPGRKKFFFWEEIHMKKDKKRKLETPFLKTKGFWLAKINFLNKKASCKEWFGEFLYQYGIIFLLNVSKEFQRNREIFFSGNKKIRRVLDISMFSLEKYSLYLSLVINGFQKLKIVESKNSLYKSFAKASFLKFQKSFCFQNNFKNVYLNRFKPEMFYNSKSFLSAYEKPQKISVLSNLGIFSKVYNMAVGAFISKFYLKKKNSMELISLLILNFQKGPFSKNNLKKELDSTSKTDEKFRTIIRKGKENSKKNLLKDQAGRDEFLLANLLKEYLLITPDKKSPYLWQEQNLYNFLSAFKNKKIIIQGFGGQILFGSFFFTGGIIPIYGVNRLSQFFVNLKKDGYKEKIMDIYRSFFAKFREEIIRLNTRKKHKGIDMKFFQKKKQGNLIVNLSLGVEFRGLIQSDCQLINLLAEKMHIFSLSGVRDYFQTIINGTFGFIYKNSCFHFIEFIVISFKINKLLNFMNQTKLSWKYTHKLFNIGIFVNNISFLSSCSLLRNNIKIQNLKTGGLDKNVTKINSKFLETLVLNKKLLFILNSVFKSQQKITQTRNNFQKIIRGRLEKNKRIFQKIMMNELENREKIKIFLIENKILSLHQILIADTSFNFCLEYEPDKKSNLPVKKKVGPFSQLFLSIKTGELINNYYIDVSKNIYNKWIKNPFSNNSRNINRLENDKIKKKNSICNLITQMKQIHFQRANDFVCRVNLINFFSLENFPANLGFKMLRIKSSDELDPFSKGLYFEIIKNNYLSKKIVQLSGGEKTLSSIIFAFFLNVVRKSPLFVFDEIDAALDNLNLEYLFRFLLLQGKFFQIISVSLRICLLELVNQLFGIRKNNFGCRLAILR